METRLAVSGLLPSLTPTSGRTHFCHLRSHSGHNAGVALACAPTNPECTVPPLLFRVLLLERLQLPLPIAEATCEGCGDPVDPLGRHEPMPSDRPSQEAGYSHRTNGGTHLPGGGRSGAMQRLSPRHEHWSLQRGRASRGGSRPRSSMFRGCTTRCGRHLVSALCSSGEPQPHAAEVDGAALERARHVKEATYAELAASERCRLVVLAIETGGRWSEEAVRQLAIARARDVPQYTTQSRGLGNNAGHACYDMRGRFRHFSGRAIEVVRHMVPHRRHGTWSRRLAGTGSAVGLSEQ